jgi:uncharacterized peroxidase-related enzyme
MSWIHEVPEDEADAALRPIYAAITQQRGKVARILSVQSLDPPALQHHLDLYMALMFAPGPLSRREREAIAVTVSAANGCAYCVAHHLEPLRRYEKKPAILDAIREAPDSLTDLRLRAMLLYARMLTTQPAAMRQVHVQALRDVGLDDAQILRVGEITAYFNFVNRLALGLGVQVDDEDIAGYHEDG